MVRTLKFLRQNDNASYPGGYIITALAADNYRPSDQGDDIALLATMEGIAAQLSTGVATRDPLKPRYALPLRRIDESRLTEFRGLIQETLEPLTGVDGLRRTSAAALRAWQKALRFEL